MFTLYKSSAGSGKTFMLVKEYLKICLVQPHNYSAILAITFTNKAATEMKTRIINSLHHFLVSGTDAIVNLVMDETNISPEKAAENCRILLDSILHSYSDFSVMTIDSFIGRIVNTFAYDLDMPMKYDVELDTPGISTEVVERLLADARKDNFIGHVLTEFAISKIHSTGSWAIDHELGKIGGITFNEKYIEPIGILSSSRYHETFWMDLIDSIARQCFSFQKHINSLAQQGLDIIQKHNLTINDFAYGKSGAAGALMKYAAATVPDDFNIGQRFVDGNWAAKSATPEIRQKINSALQNGLEAIAAELLDYIRQNRERYLSYYLVFKNIYSEALINQFIRLIEGYKIEKNIVPLSDFSRKVYTVVKNEPVPFLYWRLGIQYRHIMIDEFQDTSHQQWANLLPLIDESLANGHFNMAVGDGKQAIYRWRAGDVKIMENQLPEDLGGHLIRNKLERNFRSRKEIVDFNNQFFPAVPGRFGGTDHLLFSKLYSKDSVLQKSVSEETGYIKVSIVPLTDGLRKVEKQEKILERIVSDIRTMIEEKNGYSLQDIAILVRKNSDAEKIAQFLSEKGIRVISPDSLVLKHAPVVRFIISALRYITSEDKIALLNMWLFTGKETKAFERMMKSPSGPSDIVNLLSSKFADRIHRLYQLPVYEAIEDIIQIFALNKTYCGFLQGLLEVALNHSEKLSSDIPHFLEWWDTGNSATLSSVEKSNAVTLSTIHKSKGLEYPVVLIPFNWEIADRPGFGKSNFLWVQHPDFGNDLGQFPFIVDMQKNLEESWFREQYQEEQEMSRIDNINLLYVAFTRATDRLYLYLEEDNKNPERVSGEPKNTHELIRQVIGDMNLQTTADGLSLGSQSQKSTTQAEYESAILDTLPAYDWRHKITLKRRARDLWKLDETELKEKTETGVLIHEILAGIKTIADIDKAVENQYRSGLMASVDKAEYKTLITALMNIEYSKGKVGDWFKPGLQVKNEKTIASADRESRPDRVILDENRTLVIDYKTGKKTPDHLAQMNTYGDLLQEMGYSNIEKYLLYLESREVVEV